MSVFKCRHCGKTYPMDTRRYMCECGGLFDLDFAPPPFDAALIDRAAWSMFRYRSFMPDIGESWREVTMGEGMTPVVSGGDGLLLKLDFAMPTLSFKDRGAAMIISHCKRLGVKRVIQDSSGNAGTSVAAYAARAGIACTIYVPGGTSPAKISMIRAYGAAVEVVDGTRDRTAEVCRAAASSGEAYYASHVFNPLFYQGTKTYIYEVYEQLGALPDNLFIPVGNGTLLLGALLAIDGLLDAGAIAVRPNIIAVQSENCDPLLKAYDADGAEPAPVTPSPTLAEGIAIGKPLRGAQILGRCRRAGARMIHSPEAGILHAQADLAAMGFFVEHTAAATYAAYRSQRDSGALRGTSLIPLCGAGLKSVK